MAKSFNQAIIMGNLTRDPELRSTPTPAANAPASVDRVSRLTNRNVVALAIAYAEIRKLFQWMPSARNRWSSGYHVSDCGSAATGYPDQIPSDQSSGRDRYADTPKSNESLGARKFVLR